MLVYRFENEEGYGPFNGGFLAFDMDDAMRDAGRHDDPDGDDTWHNRFPTPWEDGIDTYFPGEERCGVLTPRQAVTWFPKPCREVLYREGFQLKAYEVPEDAVQVGGHQVVFDAARAVPVTLPDRNQLRLPLAA